MRELVSNLDGVIEFEVRLIEDIDIDIDHLLFIGIDHVFDLSRSNRCYERSVHGGSTFVPKKERKSKERFNCNCSTWYCY